MLLNESGLLSKPNVLAATLVHFHRFICTAIIRVGVTQFRVTDETHCTNNLGVALARIRYRIRGPRNLAAMSSVFRHICAR
jgi:hypothetical protein